MDATARSFEPGKLKEVMGQSRVDGKVETGFQHEREEGVGILCFVNEENLGFEGVLKQRYVMVRFFTAFFTSVRLCKFITLGLYLCVPRSL